MNKVLHPFREALMVHFSESPYSRLNDAVEMRGKGGFTLRICADRKTDELTCEIEGQPNEDQINRLSRADDLLEGKIVALLEDVNPFIAQLVRESEEGHGWYEPNIRYAYEREKGDDDPDRCG